jgi:hypothetical protein
MIEAPMWVLLPGAVVAWAAYFLIRVHERGLAQRAFLASLSSQRSEHSHIHDVPDEQTSHDYPADDEQDPHELEATHARSVPAGMMYLPPGIPSVAERLDRWTELS